MRAYFLYDRRRLGLLSRLATRTLRAYVRATLGGSCAGCGAPACIAFGHAGLSGPSFSHPWILGSATPNNGSNVTWQAGAVATTSGTCGPYGNCTTGVICQSETPARGHTWGAIKSLYR